MPKLRNIQTGEVLDYSDSEAVARIAGGFFEPVDPEAPVVMTGADGQTTLVQAQDIVNRLRQTGGLSRGVDSEELGQILEGRRQELVQESLGERGAGTFGLEALTSLSFGANIPIVEAVTGEEITSTLDQLREANPTAALAGSLTGAIAPALIPGGQGEAAASLGRLGSLARLGRAAAPGGLATTAGAGARNLLLRQLTGRGTVSAAETAATLGERALARAGGVATEEAIFSGGLALRDQLSSNDPLLAEQVIGDAGIGLALGLGAEALTGGMGRIIGRFSDVVRNADGGGAIVSAARRPSLQQFEDFRRLPANERRDILMGQVGRQSVFSDPGGRLNALARRISDLPEDQQNILFSDVGQRMFREGETAFDDVLTRSDGLSSRLEEVIELQEDISLPARTIDRLDEFGDEFARLDSAARAGAEGNFRVATRQFVDETRGLLNNLEDAAGVDVGKVIRRVDNELGKFVSRTGPDSSAQQVYRELLQTQQEVRDAIRVGVEGNTSEGAKALVREISRKFDDVTTNRRAFGDVAEVQARRNEILSDYLAARDSLSTLKTLISGRGSRSFAENVKSLVKRASRPEGQEVLTHLDTLIKASRRSGEQLSEVFPTSADSLRRLREAADEAEALLAEARTRRTVIDAFNTVQSEGTRQAGFGAIAGFTGTGAIAALGLGGGPFGMALGAGLGTALAFGVGSVFRPGSVATFLSQMNRMVERVNLRRTKAVGQLRKRMKSSARGFRPGRVGGKGSAAVFTFRAEQSRQEREQEFLELREQLAQMSENPQALANEIAASTMAAQELSPQMAEQMAQTMVVAHAHLVQHMPPVQVDPLFPDHIAVPPSRTEMDAFIRRFRIAEDPWLAMERLAEGSLTIEESDTLQAIYPEIFGAIVSDVVEVMTELGPTGISYQMKAHMGTLLGIPGHVTLEDSFLVSMQNLGAQTAEQDRAVNAPRSTQSQPQSVTVTFSESQRLANK